MSGIVNIGGLMIKTADRKAEKIINLPHPDGIATRQIIIDRHYMHPFPGKSVEINRQGRHQSFAFTRHHFGNLPFVECNAAETLYVVMALVKRSFGGFAHERKSFRQNVVKGLTMS